MTNHKGLILLFLCLLLSVVTYSQNNAQISTEVMTHNFGTISEEDGPTSHVFIVKNTGTVALVITRVTASCGCTQPEWSKAPIPPGGTGEVKVTFNPQGRPGPFHKTVSIYSNGKKGSHTLAIRGTVTPKMPKPVLVFPYSIGDLKLTTKNILFNTVRPNETLGERIHIKNEAQSSISLQLGKTPGYVTVEARPTTLQPGQEGEITILMDGRSAKRRGRVSIDLPIAVSSAEKKETAGMLHIAANMIDNFNKLSSSEKAQAPIAELSSTLIEFGQVAEKGGFFPMIGGKATMTLEITNTGSSPLQIYSVTCDDDRLDISGGKRELKAGAKATFKISIRPKDVKAKMEALINVVCNDPNGPVRLVKVTAHK